MTDQDEFLYHYTGAEALLKIVQTRTLWATRTDFTNDQFEALQVNKRLTNMIQYPDPLMASKPKYLAAIESHLQSGRYAFMTSFSRHRWSLPQFRMYAPAAGGYAIGFPRKYLAGVANLLVECDYSVDHLTDWCVSYVRSFFAYAATLDNETVTPYDLNIAISSKTDLFNRRLIAQLTFKAAEFRAEDEVRLVKFVSGDDDPIEYRISRDGNAVVPYQILQLPNEPITVPIMCGPNRDPTLSALTQQSIRAAAWAKDTKWEFLTSGYSSGFLA